MTRSNAYDEFMEEMIKKFPDRWTRVTQCRNDADLQSQQSLEAAKQKYSKEGSPCPVCGKGSEQLAWLYYIDTEHCSPRKGGWMTVCDEDEKEVDFFVERQEFYPWEMVEAERNNEFQPKFRILYGPPKGSEHCPICKRPPEELSWIWFSSPQEDWASLAGRAGWLSICDPCHIQVEFEVSVMS